MANSKPGRGIDPALKPETLNAIRDFRVEHGEYPTRRDLCDALGLSSTSVVDYRLRQLQGDGLIRFGRKNGRIINIRFSPNENWIFE